MKTIFLTAGHHRKDPGAVYNGRKEADETIRLRNAISEDLRKRGVAVWNDSDDWDLSRTIAEIKKISKPDDIICDLHFNAGGPAATGTEVLVADDADIVELNLAKKLGNAVASVLMIRNRGIKREKDTRHKKLGMMRPTGKNVLIEVCFISSKHDMLQYDTFFDALVKEIAAALA